MLNKISSKFQSKRKIKRAPPRTKGIRNGLPNKKLEIYTECKFINQRHNKNFVKLRRRIEKSTQDLHKNVVKFRYFFFTKSDYKLVQENLHFTPTPKVSQKKNITFCKVP